jgi:hypothetical protein
MVSFRCWPAAIQACERLDRCAQLGDHGPSADVDCSRLRWLSSNGRHCDVTPKAHDVFMADGRVTRAVTFTLDPSPAQVRMLRNYCGATRFSFNWVIGQVKDNLATRTVERNVGIAETDLTPPVIWSAYSLRKQFNAVKDIEAPWWRETTKHSFDTGITQAATALKN